MRPTGATRGQCVFRKKKIIWWERETIVAGADDARLRGENHVAVRHRRHTDPYYGPVTVESDIDDESDPGALRLTLG